MARDRLKWFKTAFPVHGIGWQLPSFLASLIAIAAVGGAVWFLLRERAEDLLTAEVHVWILLLTLAVAFAGVTAIGFVLVPRLRTAQPGGSSGLAGIRSPPYRPVRRQVAD